MAEKKTAYNVTWADGRAKVSYPTAALANKAAKMLNGDVSKGPAYGRIRTTLPKHRETGPK